MSEEILSNIDNQISGLSRVHCVQKIVKYDFLILSENLSCLLLAEIVVLKLLRFFKLYFFMQEEKYQELISTAWIEMVIFKENEN